MTKFRHILAIITTLFVTSCGLLERHNDNFIVKTKQGLSVYATDDSIETDSNGYADHFKKDVEAYLDDLLRDLYVQDDKIRRCEFFTETYKFLSHVSVVIDATGDINARALFWRPTQIILTNDYAMESLLGHELVRVIMYNCGYPSEALELSDGGWTGLRGQLWNIAETDSLPYIDDPIP